jgi:hypothetical protein
LIILKEKEQKQIIKGITKKGFADINNGTISFKKKIKKITLVK